MHERRDPYEVLGVSRQATAEEIRKAYRQAALKHHPDRNNGDPKAAERFKEATEAFQILSDDHRRSVFDQFGFAGLDGMGGGMPNVDLGDIFGNFQDLFSEFFGAPSGRRARNAARRGPDLRTRQTMTLEEAALGVKREIQLRFPAPCEECKGTGAEAGTQPTTCPTCRGSGQISNARGFVMFTAPCPACRGEGRVVKTPCPACGGSGEKEKPKKIVVTFPAGIDDGQVLRVPGQGIPGMNGGPPGDVLVEVSIEEHARFERHGADLATRAKISIPEAILGTKVDVEGIDGEKLVVDVAPGTQPNHVVVLKGKGVTRLEGSKGRGARGALHVVLEVEVPAPATMSPKARELLEALQKELGKSAK